MAYRSCWILIFLLISITRLFSQDKQICISIDDLPIQRIDRFMPQRQINITEGILNSLVKYGIPAIGFVNEKNLYTDGKPDPARVDLIRKWLEKGMEIGNHTYSHPDYDHVTFDAFREDLLKGQVITGPLGAEYNKPIRYFRHPYLHRGDSQAKADSLSDFLNLIGLTEAPVTIDNSEWIFGSAYDIVYPTSDTLLLQKIGAAYITYMEAKLHYFEDQSQKLFGRNIRQILLFHANALNAEYLDELAGMLQKNGYQFISLSEALQDDAYRSEDQYYKRNGISWLHRWAYTRGYRGDFFGSEPLAPEFVKEIANVKYE